jgi:hypothetical protein
MSVLGVKPTSLRHDAVILFWTSVVSDVARTPFEKH